MRTLSKAYGLAGIRCGITLANNTIIQLLKKIISPYPLPKPVIDIVNQKLNSNKVSNQIEIINKEKNKLFDFLSSSAFIKKVWKSDANFILFEPINPKRIFEICNNNGIVLRDRGNECNLNNCIRVSVGNPSENAFLMEVLSRV